METADYGSGEVRVNWTRALLAELTESERDKAYSWMPADTREAVRGAGLLSWIHLRHHMFATMGIRKAATTEGLEAANRRAVLKGGQGALFGSLARGFIRLFGPTPRAAMKAYPLGWKLIFRRVTELESEFIDPGHVTICAPGLGFLGEEDLVTFARGLRGGVYGGLDYVGWTGTVRLEPGWLETGDLNYTVRWNPQDAKALSSSSTTA